MNTVRSVFSMLLVTLAFSVVCFPAWGATYHEPHGRYAFEIPSGWSVTPLDSGDAIASNGAAYVRIVSVPGGGNDKRVVDQVTDQVGKQWQKFTKNGSGAATLAGRHGVYAFFTGINPKGVEAVLRVVAAPFGDDAWMLIMSAPNADFVQVQETLKQIEGSFAVGGASPASKPEQPERTVAPADSEDERSTVGAGEGHLVQGALTGVGAATAAFRAGLRHTRGVFDASVHLLSVVRSKDNPNLTLASFSAVQGGETMGGLVVSVYDPEGGSRFAILYDAPDHLAKSLPTMLKSFDAATQEQLEKSRPQGGNAALDFAHFEQESKHVSLNRVPFQDNTASIGVASGFKPIQMAGGKFTATAADGAYMTVFRACNILDPRGTLYQGQVQLGKNIHSGPMKVPGQVILQYDADPVSAWKKYLIENARQNNAINPDPQVLKREVVPGKNKDFPMVNISGTMTVNGEAYVFTGCLVGSPPPPATGGWSVQVTILQAPTAHAATDMPAMIAMQQSEKVDMNAVHEQTMQYIATINQQTTAWLRANKAAYDADSQRRFNSAMSSARATRDAMDRSTAGFIHYINGTSVLQHNPTGAHGSVETDLAKALEQADPAHLSVVSPKDYIKGVDY